MSVKIKHNHENFSGRCPQLSDNQAVENLVLNRGTRQIGTNQLVRYRTKLASCASVHRIIHNDL